MQPFSNEVLNSPGAVPVDFWAPWCGPCKAVSPILDNLAVKYAGKLTVVKVNVDENPVTASRYGNPVHPEPSSFQER